MKIAGFILAVLIGLPIAPSSLGSCEDSTMDLAKMLPDSVGIWKNAGEDGLYDRETIFRYMNGSGEIYLSFDFRCLLVRRFADAADRAITVEIYDMGRSAEAFGIFTRNRSGDEAGIGQGSEFHTDHLFFWRSKYFVTVFAEQEFEESRKAILALGEGIAQRIGEDGPEPALAKMLPGTNLDERSVRYFHKHTDLNQHYFLSDENILELGEKVEAVLAVYERAEAYVYLLLIRYPNEEAASSAHRNYLAMYTPETGATDPVRVEDGSWTASTSSGNHVVAVFDAPSAECAMNLLSEGLAPIEGGER
jgi:hypothetical protein